MGATDEAMENFQSAIEQNEELTESKFALATALYIKGETDRATKLAQTALISNQKYADVQYLKENLWGEKMIGDAQKLLSNLELE